MRSAAILPEWERIRLLPHASVIHRFTVDRHVVETCIEASALIRRVARPDVLMVAALLHDIGKGGLTEHSVAGEPIARAIATRMGFGDDEVDADRHARPLAPAARRRPRPPATPTTPRPSSCVTSRLGSAEALDLLEALTEADARATSPQGVVALAGRPGPPAGRALAALGSSRRRGRRPRARSAEVTDPAGSRRGPPRSRVEVEETDRRRPGHRDRPRDRVGLLADGAAMLALQRSSVRAARAWTQDDYGVVGLGGRRRATSTPRCSASGFDAIVERPGRRPHPALAPGGRPPGAHGRRTSRGARARRPCSRSAPPTGPVCVYLVCSALADLDIIGPLGARVDARPAGRRRVLRAGGGRRRAGETARPPRPRTPSATRCWPPRNRWTEQ